MQARSRRRDSRYFGADLMSVSIKGDNLISGLNIAEKTKK
jgi:hypothetical protein